MTQRADWDIITDVGITALGVAAARAIESHRSDRLMSDPYAELFVAAARPHVPLPVRPEQVEDGGLWQAMSAYLGVRSRFFDEFFTVAPPVQAVLLASGLDVRGYRLDWPAGAVVYELDVPKVLQFKQGVLDDNNVRPHAEIRHVGVDLRDDWPAVLLGMGFDRSTPTTWLAEGLLPYLPGDAVQRLFAMVHELSAPGSRIAVEHFDGGVSEFVRDMPMTDVTDLLGPFVATLSSWESNSFDAVAWLADHGWQATAAPADQVAAGFGRPFEQQPDVFRHSVLTTASRSARD
jgi:methyltransferase (TIGR00027 family)